MNKIRNYKLDNTKGLLIFLVVLGHMADFYVNISDDMKFIYFAGSIFGMPLFIFISGLFIKSTINNKRFKIERVFSYLILYFLLKTMIFLLMKYGFSQDITFNTFNEPFVPWYMFAMAIWIILTYLLKNIKKKYLLPFSFLFGLIIGYDSYASDYFVISRIIVFFPFFLLGYYLSEINLMKVISKRSIQLFSIVFILALTSYIFVNIQDVYQFRGFLTGRNPYEALKQPVFGSIYRAFFYCLTIATSLAVMAIMPNKKFFLTTVGNRSLQIYFLHIFFILILQHFNIEDNLKLFSSAHWLKIYASFSIPLTLLLAVKPLEWPFKQIMNLKFTSLFK